MAITAAGSKKTIKKKRWKPLVCPLLKSYRIILAITISAAPLAEPWEKFISVANGSVFGAWVDLREGSSFGQTFSIEINPGIAIFVPRGVANGYQTLEDNVTYTYLVNAHWSPEAQYTFVNLFDPALGINWPISQQDAVISEKDAAHPLLKDVIPMMI